MAIKIVASDDGAVGTFDLSHYPTEFLECREAKRHRTPAYNEWRWSVLKSVTGRPIEYTRTAQCLSCKAIVQDVIDATSGMKKRKITRPTLPQVYRIPRDAGVTVYDLRLELMSRIATDAEVIVADTDNQEVTRP